MILPRNDPPGKPGPVAVRPHPGPDLFGPRSEDDAVELFTQLVQTRRTGNQARRKTLSIALRQLGWSVAAIEPPAGGFNR